MYEEGNIYEGPDEGLVWYPCRECGSEMTWFRVGVIPGVELIGWVHRIQVWRKAGRCIRDRAMTMEDLRDMIAG
jgi:hypothetical protein